MTQAKYAQLPFGIGTKIPPAGEQEDGTWVLYKVHPDTKNVYAYTVYQSFGAYFHEYNDDR